MVSAHVWLGAPFCIQCLSVPMKPCTILPRFVIMCSDVSEKQHSRKTDILDLTERCGHLPRVKQQLFSSNLEIQHPHGYPRWHWGFRIVLHKPGKCLNGFVYTVANMKSDNTHSEGHESRSPCLRPRTLRILNT